MRAVGTHFWKLSGVQRAVKSSLLCVFKPARHFVISRLCDFKTKIKITKSQNHQIVKCKKAASAAFSVVVLETYRGLVDASPFAAGLLALGFCELLGVGLGLLLGLLDGLVPMLPEFGLEFEAAPFPLTVIRSFTRRLPANELAMRRAVCFSLPV